MIHMLPPLQCKRTGRIVSILSSLVICLVTVLPREFRLVASAALSEKPVAVANLSSIVEDSLGERKRCFSIPQEISSLHYDRVSFFIGKPPNEIPFLQNCSVSSQVQIIDTGSPNYWILEATDEHGRPKQQGGDEFYITYKDHSVANRNYPTAVALIKDLHNGRYLLDFVQPPVVHADKLKAPSSNGTLTIQFQHTCGIGAFDPPSKESWNSGGFTLATSKRHDIPAPPIRTFQPPLQPTNLLGQYDSVVAFGDSLMEQFVSTYTRGELANKRFFRENLIWKNNVAMTLSTTNLPDIIRKLKAWHGQDFKASNETSLEANYIRKVALILGSSTWDVLKEFSAPGEKSDPGFADHLEAARLFIQQVQRLYPNIDIFWKSPTALHIHRSRNMVNKPTARGRLKYMSSSRIAFLHEKQKKLMHDLDIPYLDIYDATYLSASWTIFGDGRHYVDSMHEKTIDWFY